MVNPPDKLLDKLLIRGLAFHGHCGVTEEERRSGQRLSVDLEVSLSLDAASRSDHLEDTVNYGEICSMVLSMGRTEKFALIESLAGRIAEELLNVFPRIDEVFIRVHKMHPPIEEIQGSFAVELRRSRNSGSKTGT